MRKPWRISNKELKSAEISVFLTWQDWIHQLSWIFITLHESQSCCLTPQSAKAPAGTSLQEACGQRRPPLNKESSSKLCLDSQRYLWLSLWKKTCLTSQGTAFSERVGTHDTSGCRTTLPTTNRHINQQVVFCDAAVWADPHSLWPVGGDIFLLNPCSGIMHLVSWFTPRLGSEE